MRPSWSSRRRIWTRSAAPGRSTSPVPGGIAADRARGGTLVLDGIDEFPRPAQQVALLALSRGARSMRRAHRGHRPPPPGAARGERRAAAPAAAAAQRGAARGPAAPGADGRPPGPGRGLPGAGRRRAGPARRPARRRGAGETAVTELAGQRARAGEPDGPGRAGLPRWRDRSRLDRWTDPPAAEPLPGGLNLERLERDAIARSLHLTGGRRNEAARALGISARTLRNKIRKYQLA